MSQSDPKAEAKSKAAPPETPVSPMSDDEVGAYVTLVAQFLTMVGVAIIGIGQWPWSVPTWILVGAALVIMVWAKVSLARSFRVLQIPNGAGLITSGIYAYVRNPMYLALILAGVGLCLGAPNRGWIVFCFMTIVLIAKIFGEEKALTAAYPDYPTYKSKTKRMIPFVW